METEPSEDGRPTPLIAHVIFRLGVGGLENGVVNLINGLPAEKYRHAIVCIDRITDFQHRLLRKDVELVSIRKKPGTDWQSIRRIHQTFRRMKPDIVHTRNLGALDALLPAFLAGVKCRIHGEHGWDISDVSASNMKYRLIRRIHSPLVTKFVALSSQLSDYLQQGVGINPSRICRLPNGVDTTRFLPSDDKIQHRLTLGELFQPDSILIGTVGRLEAEKDPMNLVEAFARVFEKLPSLRRRLRLVIVGDGSLRESISRRLRELEIDGVAWVPGARDDIAKILQCLDLFVLPSLAEGISNTILEAMATGLAVVATEVGGNPELVLNGRTGMLVPAGDSSALAEAIMVYLADPELCVKQGFGGRERAINNFGLDRMIKGYEALYDDQLARYSALYPK